MDKLLDIDEKDNNAPILPLDEEHKDENNNINKNKDEKDDEYDIQKELEAKFDELFGPIDEEDDN